MNIDDYISLVVVVELDTGAKHEGVLEESNVFGYVKITNGAEVYHLPRKEIVAVQPIHGVSFQIK